MRYGCRFGVPHNLKILNENPQVKWEACTICGNKFRFNKGYKGRINNVEYLKIHARAFAQRTGPTKRLYKKLYSPKEATIII